MKNKKNSWLNSFFEIDFLWWGLYVSMLASLLLFSKDVLSIPHIMLGLGFTLIFFLHNGLMKIVEAIKEAKQ